MRQRNRGLSARALVPVTAGVVLAVTASVAIVAASRPGKLGEVGVGRNSPATSFAMQVAHNSPQLAADPTDEELLVLANRLDAPDFGCALQVSFDGGRGWVPTNPVPELPPGADKCYAPEVGFDADGTLYYLLVGLEGRGNRPMGAYLVTSDDQGRTFSEPRRVLGPRRFQVRMAIDRSLGDGGRIHLVWLRPSADPPIGGLPAPPNPIMAAHSDDGGRTWSEPVQVSDPDRERVVAPALAVGADGAVHVAYYDLKGDARDYRGQEGPVWEGTWSVVATSSADGGRHFAPGVVVDDGVAPAERVMLIFTMPAPALAADRGGRLVAAWQDARHGDVDVLSARSTDGGRSWQGPVRVNDDQVGSGATQSLPQVAFSPNGRLDAVFYDRRHDPKDRYAHVMAASSTDRGATFTANVRVTSQPTDSRNGQTYPIPSAEGQVEFGSRLGLASRDGGAVAAWTDTRNARITPQQAIFTARLRLPRTDGAGIWPGLAAGLVVVAAASSLLVLRRQSWLGGRPSTGLPGARRRVAMTRGVSAGLWWAVLGGGLVVALLLWGPARSRPAGPATLTVTQREGLLELDRQEVPAGRVVVRAHNVGREPHEVVVLPLPADMEETLAEALRSERRRAVTVLAALSPREAGGEAVFALDLPPGRYALVCFQSGSDGQSHARAGEHAEFTVHRSQ